MFTVGRTAHPSMRIHNIQFSTPEADRKVLLWVSIPLMFLFWVFLAAVLAVTLKMIFSEEIDWGLLQFAFTIFLAVLVVFLIPFQLVRYIRELRA
jgi:membrane protein YdbS with pleckstrin-like domain